jgi:putative transposase
MTDTFERNHRCYGHRRLQASLTRQCVGIIEKIVLRQIKQESLAVAKPNLRRFGPYLGDISSAPDNLLNLDFRAAAPNEKWRTDITEFQIPAGKVYPSPMIHCFINWSLGTRPDAQLVNTMWDQTFACCGERPVVHSDRSAHSRWPVWLTRAIALSKTAGVQSAFCPRGEYLRPT